MKNNLDTYLMENVVKDFCRKILYEELTVKNIHEKDILDAYDKILKSFSVDYQIYNENITPILDCFERNVNSSFAYSLFVNKELYKKFIKLPIPKKTDLSIINISPDDEIVKKFERVIHKSMSKNAVIRISELTLDVSDITEDDMKQILSVFINKLQFDSDTLIWDKEQVDDTIFNLAIVRALCRSINYPELFYYVTNMFFDRLLTSQLFQPARDICEEILIASFKDGLECHGFFALPAV